MLEGINYESTVFPGGEVHVTIRNDVTQDVIITAYLKNAYDIMELLLATDALRRRGVKNIYLYMPYVPYARQDRVTSPGTAHSLKVFANLINAQNYTSVTVFDPHSDVCEAVFDRLTVNTNHRFVADMLCQFNIDVVQESIKPFLVAPDAGAIKKFDKLTSYLRPYFNFDTLECSKKRDPKTGNLSGFAVPAGTDLQGRPCVVIDDICDGGGTFLGIADALKSANAGSLYLIVSHGIFSQGYAKLLEKYEQIGTSNSFRTELPNNNRVIITNWG